METLTLIILGVILFILIFSSAFFSGSEISMMSINPYRLRHLVRLKHRGAIRVNKLLERPDRLLSVILIANTFANIIAAAIATFMAVILFGEVGVVVATILLTLVILIFAEITPKILATLYPQRVASFVSLPLMVLLEIFAPLVWLTNLISHNLLRIFGVKVKMREREKLTREELRSIVYETGGRVSEQHKNMLLSILDLEKVIVEDIMVPRNEIAGIDLNDHWDEILDQIENSQHTRMPIYQGEIEQVKGIVHMRDVAKHITAEGFDKEQLLEIAEACYFVPETVPLHTQLLNFQQNKQRICLVVDEYGDIQGLATLEDILEEIVGEFTTDLAATSRDIYPQADGSMVVDGGVNIRELNRTTSWELPTTGPKTLSGLLIEHLEFIPPAGTSVLINNYPIEVMQVKGNMIKSVKILPKIAR